MIDVIFRYFFFEKVECVVRFVTSYDVRYGLSSPIDVSCNNY